MKSARATSKSIARSTAKSKQVAKSRKPQAAVRSNVKPPLNLSRANAKPAKKVTGRSRGSDS
jgi:hypothetical protein